MEEMILILIQTMVSVFEVWLCYQLLYVVVLEKQYMSKLQKCIVYGNIVVLGGMLAFNRKMSFFSDVMFAFCIIVISFCVWIIQRKKLLLIIGTVLLYYSFISLLDFFFAFISMIFLEEKFMYMVYYGYDSLGKNLIFMGSRGIAYIFIMFISNRVQSVRNEILEYRSILFSVSIVFLILVKRYQIIIDSMAHGEQIMRGANSSFSLLSAIIILMFGGIILFKYQIIKKEKEILLLRNTMMEEKYQEIFRNIEKKQQLIHDVKNHFIVLKKFEKENEWEKLHNYLDEISKGFLDNSVKNWTGNRVIDLVLNQKKAEAEKKEIEINIHTEMVVKMPISDSEIISLFGNLLDNAIEACEKIRVGKRWVSVKLEKQNSLIFIEIMNSIAEPPLQKNGELISRKADGEMHGYGLKSVRYIVDKYEGVFSYKVLEKKMVINVSFFDAF